MIAPSARRRLRAAWLAGALLVVPAAANAAATTFVDLEAGAGFSTNPFLQFNSKSAAFGRISASGQHSWSTERSTTTLRGYVEDTTYLRDYGSKQLFDVGAHHLFKASPTLTLSGDVDFTGDFAGQLSNRLYYVPNQPVVPVPGDPLPPTISNPDLFGLNTRQYRLSGRLGAAIQAGARGSLSLSAGAQRTWFTGGLSDLNYSSFDASIGYSQQISERTNVGGSLSYQHQQYVHGHSDVINPALTAHTQLAEDMTADASIGALIIRQDSFGVSDTSVSPSFSGSLCKLSTNTSFCASVARTAQSALNSRIANGSGRASVNTTGSLTYFRKLTAKDTLQAALSATRYSSSGFNNGGRLSTTYVSGVVGYDRKIGDRLATGVSGGVRKLFQVGPDPDLDLNASVYLRYRLGDLL